MATEKRLDLVEREAVKDAIGFMNLHFLGHGESKSVLDSINEVPSVDAVEVVRCKECRHWIERTADGIDTFHTCWFNGSITGRKHFCSYGERKKDA